MNLQDSCVPAEQLLTLQTRTFKDILSNSISSQKPTKARDTATLRSDLAEDEQSNTTAQNTRREGLSSSLLPSLSVTSNTNTVIKNETVSNIVKEDTANLQNINNMNYSTPPPHEHPTDVSVVTPFLVKHISDQSMIPKDNFHRFCYRHNPDVTCNKRTDEVKMMKIQQQLDKLPSRDQEAITHVWSIFSAAPDPHRSLILRGLLSQCCFPQLSFISQEVSSLIRIDFISTLPMEISLKILCYLDCNSLCNAAQVSRKWKSLADDDRVWHHMCEQHIDRKCPNCGWGLPLMHMKRAREFTTDDDQANNPDKRRKVEELPAGGEGQSSAIIVKGNNGEGSQEDGSARRVVLKKRPWKSVYSERFKLEKNWRKGIHTIKTFVGHSDGVTCLQFNGKYLMTGSYDSSIKIWKVSTGECIRTLTGHTKGVRALVFDSQKLITAGLDSTIKVWNYHTGQCISTYRGHDDAVVSVDFCNRTIVSGSADHTVKVWHVDSRTCYTLRGHTDWVNSVKIHSQSNTVFSASDDTTIRMWDLENNQCLRVFGGIENNGHIGQVQCVIPLIYKDKIVSDGHESENEYHPVDGNGSVSSGTATPSGLTTDVRDDGSEDINDIQLPNNPNYPTHLLTSSLDNTVKLWDIKTGKCIRTQFGHIEGVWSISADTFRIISGSHDRTVKVWDLQSGKCLHTFGNSSSVSSVGLSDARFCVGLENGTVKMFCFD